MNTNDTAYPYTFTGTITAVRRAGHSRSGNPFHDVAFVSSVGNGRILTTKKDGVTSYELGKNYEGKPARIHARVYRGDLVIESIELLSD